MESEMSVSLVLRVIDAVRMKAFLRFVQISTGSAVDLKGHRYVSGRRLQIHSA